MCCSFWSDRPSPQEAEECKAKLKFSGLVLVGLRTLDCRSESHREICIIMLVLDRTSQAHRRTPGIETFLDYQPSCNLTTMVLDLVLRIVQRT
jgi:hypothetical protein